MKSWKYSMIWYISPCKLVVCLLSYNENHGTYPIFLLAQLPRFQRHNFGSNSGSCIKPSLYPFIFILITCISVFSLLFKVFVFFLFLRIMLCIVLVFANYFEFLRREHNCTVSEIRLIWVQILTAISRSV